MSSITVGSTVKLLNGGPIMVVNAIARESAECVWHTSADILQREWLNVCGLLLAEDAACPVEGDKSELDDIAERNKALSTGTATLPVDLYRPRTSPYTQSIDPILEKPGVPIGILGNMMNPK